MPITKREITDSERGWIYYKHAKRYALDCLCIPLGTRCTMEEILGYLQELQPSVWVRTGEILVCVQIGNHYANIHSLAEIERMLKKN